MKFPTWARVAGLFSVILINGLVAGLAFEWPFVARLIIAIVVGIAGGIVSYGLIPTKTNLDAYRAHLLALNNGTVVKEYDWVKWVGLAVVVGIVIQAIANA